MRYVHTNMRVRDVDASLRFYEALGYGHIALSVEDLDAMLERLAAAGIEPEKPPYHRAGGRSSASASCRIRTAIASS